MPLKVYTADFVGHYPVGTAAVVVAPDVPTAKTMLNDELTKRGLPQDEDDIDVKLVPTTDRYVGILLDGNY